MLAAAPVRAPAAGGPAVQASATPPAAPPAGTARAAPPGTIDADGMRFHYWPGRQALAAHLARLAAAFQPLPGLPPGLFTPADPVHIYMAPDPARFDSLTEGAAPGWGAGIAEPARGVIVLPAYASRRAQADQLGAILRHELAHVALHRFLGPRRIPRWFDEGYAVWASDGLDWNAAWLLRIAFALHRAPPLDSLALEWPAGETDARVAYLLSATAVQFLASQAGVRGLGLFLLSWRDTGFEPALRATYGLTSALFEKEWRAFVARRYGWAVVLSNSLVFWLLLTPFLLVLVLIRRHRDRERLDRLRATEPPDAPAFWEEGGNAEAGEAPPDRTSPGPGPPTRPGEGGGAAPGGGM